MDCTKVNCPTHGKCYCRRGGGTCGYHCIKGDAVKKEDGTYGCLSVKGDVKWKDEPNGVYS